MIKIFFENNYLCHYKYNDYNDLLKFLKEKFKQLKSIKDINLIFINIKNNKDFVYNIDLNYKCIFYISIDNDNIIINIKNSLNNIIKKFVWKLNKINGNCVDKFIVKKLNSNILTINDLMSDIENRQNIRQKEICYHDSSCYENDYAQLCRIRDNAIIIFKNCQKMIEQLSEPYSKL